ncbi:hypothetical protein Droror1_Dr00003440 [Drosera rotundifolia]
MRQQRKIAKAKAKFVGKSKEFVADTQISRESKAHKDKRGCSTCYLIAQWRGRRENQGKGFWKRPASTVPWLSGLWRQRDGVPRVLGECCCGLGEGVCVAATFVVVSGLGIQGDDRGVLFSGKFGLFGDWLGCCFG